MLTLRQLIVFSRTLFHRLTGATFCGALLIGGVHGQGRHSETPMKRTERAEAAAVLTALTKGWDLVDSSPEVDFLIFVSEDRDELDLYPKKSFIQMMERSALIENLDKEGSSVRQLYTRYEHDGSVWKEITEAEPIVFRYQATPKGLKFLRDAPQLIGKPIRRLRVANPPIENPSKPLKIVTYDRQAIQKLVDAFVQKARAQIEAVFAVDNDPSAPSINGFVCGPKLWRSLEPRARTRGELDRTYGEP